MILGTIDMLKNQLLGKKTDKNKRNKLSIISLTQMLDEVWASIDEKPAKTNHSQPFLSYALAKIKSSNPSLLHLKKEIPLLSRASQVLDGFYTKLEKFEDNLEGFRRFALSLSLPKGRAFKEAAYSDESDFDILEASTIGTVVVDFYLKIEGLYHTVEATERAFEMLCHRFNQDGDSANDENGDSHSPGAGTIMKTLVRFCEMTALAAR